LCVVIKGYHAYFFMKFLFEYMSHCPGTVTGILYWLTALLPYLFISSCHIAFCRRMNPEKEVKLSDFASNIYRG
jgi:hypothetical protein